MERRGRPGLTEVAKAEVWRRWRLGQSLSEIGRALGKAAGSIHGVLAARGGIRPTSSRRRPSALTVDDREEISRGLAAGLSLRAIAQLLERAPSTVSREVSKNGGVAGYRARAADERAADERRRPKTCTLERHPRLRKLVEAKLLEDWSPEQVAGWLAREYPNDAALNVSHETIYRSIYIPGRPLSTAARSCLRTRRKMRRSRRSSTRGQRRGQIPNATPIADRPKAIEKRLEIGHWEGDLIAGSGNTFVATLVERASRFTLLVKVSGKDTASVVSAVARKMERLDDHLKGSLTWDRGTEMAAHAQLTRLTSIPVFFCDPKSPWQRGTNENTNRLLRQYLPKGTSLGSHSQNELNSVAKKLNSRPRKTLNYETPAECLQGLGVRLIA
jgi:IS30 family transposase